MSKEAETAKKPKKEKGPKFHARWQWDDLDDNLEDLPVADLDLVRRTLAHIKAGSTGADLQYFFMTVLAPHYDRVVYSGLHRDAGSVVYRLADQVPVEMRKMLAIYPAHDGLWFTLEDWRTEFRLGFKNGEADIPYFVGTTPELPWM